MGNGLEQAGDTIVPPLTPREMAERLLAAHEQSPGPESGAELYRFYDALATDITERRSQEYQAVLDLGFFLRERDRFAGYLPSDPSAE